MSRFLAVTAAALLTLGAFSPLAHAADDDVRTISVQGSGSVSGKPDLAVARAGIESRGATPDEALSANTKVMTALMAAIKRSGVADRDIETSAFDVNPVYGQPTPRGANTIEGYQVTNQVTVRVRDISKLGTLLSSLVGAGANRLNGVSFEIAEPGPLLDQARKAAVEDARKRADLYAAAAGVKVKRVLSIAESSAPMAPMPMAMRAMKAGSDAVPVAGGEQSVSASVSAIYEIE
jgi:hypothetical protein